MHSSHLLKKQMCALWRSVSAQLDTVFKWAASTFPTVDVSKMESAAGGWFCILFFLCFWLRCPLPSDGTQFYGSEVDGAVPVWCGFTINQSVYKGWVQLRERESTRMRKNESQFFFFLSFFLFGFVISQERLTFLVHSSVQFSFYFLAEARGKNGVTFCSPHNSAVSQSPLTFISAVAC